MSCCDEYGNCRQGRDCPVHTGSKIGQRYPAHPVQLRAEIRWRRQVNKLAKWVLISVGIAYLALVVVSLL